MNYKFLLFVLGKLCHCLAMLNIGTCDVDCFKVFKSVLKYITKSKLDHKKVMIHNQARLNSFHKYYAE